jgi:hypothetical protein
MLTKIVTFALDIFVIGAISTAIVMIVLGKINADHLLLVSLASGVLSLMSLRLSKRALPKPDATKEESEIKTSN